MADDWKSWPMRQKIIQQIDEALRQNPKGMKKTAQEVENSIFDTFSKKEDYLQYVTKIIIHLKDQDPSPNRGNASNLNAVLTGQPMTTQQINQGATSGGQMTITTTGNQMAHQSQMIPTNNRPGQQMMNTNTMNLGPGGNIMNHQNVGGQMIQVNSVPNQMNQTLTVPQNSMAMNSANMMPQVRMQQQMPGMINNQNDWQQSKIRQQDIHMLNINQKHPGMVNSAQVNPAIGKMNQMPVSLGPNEQLSQMNVGNQIMRPGIMQARVPASNFQSFKVIPRQNVPVSVMQQHAQHPGINFISPSPSSAVPSPVGASMTMGRQMNQQGVPSPSTAMLNTPGQQAQQASPANPAQDDRGEYIEKVKELQHKYHDTLKEVAQRFAKCQSEKARNVFNLLQVLENPQIRSSMETLRRCEEVLERIGNRKVNRENEGDAKKDCPYTFLADAISNALKSGSGVQAIQRTFAPIAKTLFPSDLDPEYPKFNLLDLVPNRNRDNKVTDTIQGEIARLHPRFKVNIDRELSFGDVLILVCHLDDVNLPYVPAVNLIIPPAYPENLPKFSFPSGESRLTQFLNNAREIMMRRMFYLPESYTITMVLDAWELSVRQACGPKTFSDSSNNSPGSPDTAKS